MGGGMRKKDHNAGALSTFFFNLLKLGFALMLLLESAMAAKSTFALMRDA
jgi:hypothetical protein